MRILQLIILSCCFALPAAVATPGKFTPVRYDPFVGDWLPKNPGDYVAQVFSTGSNAYQANVLLAFDDESSATPVAVLRGTRPDEKSPAGLRDDSGDWTGEIRPDCCGSPQMEIVNSKTSEKARLSQFMRPNPRLRVKPPEGAVVLFAGRMRDGVVALASGQEPLVSRDKFSDAQVHLEFRMPGEQSAGVVELWTTARIELRQSYGRTGVVACGSMGGVAPAVRAERAPLEWQALDIEAAPGAWRVFLNGVQIHEIARPGDSAAGCLPLKIETTGEPVEFRNIWALAR